MLTLLQDNPLPVGVAVPAPAVGVGLGLPVGVTVESKSDLERFEKFSGKRWLIRGSELRLELLADFWGTEGATGSVPICWKP